MRRVQTHYSLTKHIVENQGKILMALILIISFIINIEISYLDRTLLLASNSNLSIQNDQIRAFDFSASAEDLSAQAEEKNASVGEYLTVLMAINGYSVEEADLDQLSAAQFVRLRNRLMTLYPKEFTRLSAVYSGLIQDLEYFPVPVSTQDFPWVEYVNSWGNERTYGGERTHEGTDIMAGVNQQGIYPVLSVCDGTVTNMGWLELGGYRIGITSEHGIYYYYAHLASYASGLETGDSVVAGQLIGFMGSTGYSQVEGTSGKFDVHLHFGIYVDDEEGNETAINPYYFLKNLENKVLYYNYGM